MDEIRQLGDAELEIMHIIWSNPGPMTSSEVLKRLKKRQWQLSTLMTALQRLGDKGFLTCDRTMRENLYSARISKNSYNESESRAFLEKHYDSSLREFVTCLSGANAISKKELAELRSYFDSFEPDEDN